MKLYDAIEVPNDRGTAISHYLKRNNCPINISGYNILIAVISLAVDHPELKSKELFMKFQELVSGSPTNWLSPYKAATYCLKCAGYEDKIYVFIKECACQLMFMSEKDVL